MSALLRRLSLAVGIIACLLGGPAIARPNQFPVPDHEYMVPVTGGRVYVRVNGPMDSGRPPIVLLHGGPGGTHAAVLDALELSNERAVILYDQLGSGRSDPSDDPANWTVDRFVGEIDAVRRALGSSAGTCSAIAGEARWRWNMAPGVPRNWPGWCLPAR